MRFAVVVVLALLLVPSCAPVSTSQQGTSVAAQKEVTSDTSINDLKKQQQVAESATRNPLEVPAFDDLKKRQGVKVSADGNTLNFPGGVTITHQGRFTVGDDNSGHGAVLCAWEMYLSVKKMTELCHFDGDKAFNGRLNRAINRIDDFIVANSLSSVTKAEVEQQSIYLIEQNLPSPKGADQEAAVRKQCAAEFKSLINDYRSMTPERFNGHIDDLLSVPRPAVMAPCL